MATFFTNNHDPRKTRKYTKSSLPYFFVSFRVFRGRKNKKILISTENTPFLFSVDSRADLEHRCSNPIK